MPENFPQRYQEQSRADGELELTELINTLWEGKWTIVGITAFVSSVALAVLVGIPSTFTATTSIKPISTVQADAYAESNALGFFTVERDALLDAFLEQLDDRGLFIDATKKLSLVNRDEFESQALYERKVLKFVESLQFLPPVNEDGSKRGVSRRDWELVGEYHDEEKWLEALHYVERAANARTLEILGERFTAAINVAESAREFEIQDLAMKVSNVDADFDQQMAEFETRLAFDLEDVSTQIDNALADYDRTARYRLAFLREQAAIARELGVAKNTIEAQTFSAVNGILASVDTDTPFYLRGYEAIEKEIELMESREDKRAFVSGLIELEKTKRKIEQDQTLARKEFERQFIDRKLELERHIQELEQDQTLKRAQVLFEATPVRTGEGFVAARFVPEGTELMAKNSKVMILGLVGLVSGMLSCVYVLISSAMRDRQIRESQADI